MLGLVVTDTLYRTHPDLPEGQLAKLRAAVVNARALAEVGRGLDLGDTSGSAAARRRPAAATRRRSSSDTVEAVIGAVHLDRGFDASARSSTGSSTR